jgi:hypothetical protein
LTNIDAELEEFSIDPGSIPAGNLDGLVINSAPFSLIPEQSSMRLTVNRTVVQSRAN